MARILKGTSIGKPAHRQHVLGGGGGGGGAAKTLLVNSSYLPQ